MRRGQENTFKKNGLFNKWWKKNWIFRSKKGKLNFILYQSQKNDLKKNKQLNVRPENTKLEETQEINSLTLVLAVILWIWHYIHKKQKKKGTSGTISKEKYSAQATMENNMEAPQKFKIKLFYDPVIAPVSICTKNTKTLIQIVTWIPMFIAAL